MRRTQVTSMEVACLVTVATQYHLGKVMSKGEGNYCGKLWKEVLPR